MITQLAARVGGSTLSLVINRLYGRDRPRPLHPRGRTYDAVWTVVPAGTAASVETTAEGGAATGVPVVDEPGEHPCVARHSRAVGLADGTPDIEGMALRFTPDGGDLLFAGTASGTLGRHVLWPRRGPGVCSTLIPMRSSSGPILLRLKPCGEQVWETSWSRPGGSWIRIGTLELRGASEAEVVFDPVDNPPTGVAQYPVVASLRRPAYRRAARQRR